MNYIIVRASTDSIVNASTEYRKNLFSILKFRSDCDRITFADMGAIRPITVEVVSIVFYFEICGEKKNRSFCLMFIQIQLALWTKVSGWR